jgi:hypothetical protein
MALPKLLPLVSTFACLITILSHAYINYLVLFQTFLEREVGAAASSGRVGYVDAGDAVDADWRRGIDDWLEGGARRVVAHGSFGWREGGREGGGMLTDIQGGRDGVWDGEREK